MKRFWLLSFGLALAMLALFAVAEALQLPLLTDPAPHLQQGGWWPAALGLALLAADVLIPVPSSLVMIAFGALYGVVAGSALALVGSLLMAATAFALGRLGGRWIERWVGPAERAEADRLFARHGLLAIILTRPLPILAETTAILAGATSLGWGRFLCAATAGSLPAAVIYAVTGATARTLQDGLLVSGLVIAVAAAYWFVARKLRRAEAAQDTPRPLPR